jgi:hypothetical protein
MHLKRKKLLALTGAIERDEISPWSFACAAVRRH